MAEKLMEEEFETTAGFLKQEARGEEYRENFYLLNLETILCLLIAR